jgi:hypothetical protein
MRRLIFGAVVLLTLTVSGCSLQRHEIRPAPPVVTDTITMHQYQALDWSVINTYYLSNQVSLSYPLCPGQHMIGKPDVRMTGQTVSITLWANPKTCANPTTRSIVVQLRQDLGHRPLSNPNLLQ